MLVVMLIVFIAGLVIGYKVAAHRLEPDWFVDEMGKGGK